MGIFSKKPPTLEYTSGQGLLPNVELSEYVEMSLPNRSHVYLYNMDLALREKPFAKDKSFLDSMQKYYQDPELDKEFASLTSDYLEVFMRKANLSTPDETNFFYNMFVNGMILSLVEKKSGLEKVSKIHPSLLYYHYIIADAFLANAKLQFAHVPDFRGRIDQALRGGYVAYKLEGKIAADHLWENI